MFPSTHHLLLLLLSAVSFSLTAHAYKLHFYSSSTCTGQHLGEPMTGVTFNHDTKRDICRHDFVGNTGSVVIESTGPVDDNYMAVFFTGDDCDPDTELVHGDETDRCIKLIGYRGFQVWNVDDLGQEEGGSQQDVPQQDVPQQQNAPQEGESSRLVPAVEEAPQGDVSSRLEK